MPGSLVPLTLGRWGEQGRRRKRKRTGMQVVSVTKEAVRWALLWYCHTGSCCWSANSVLEEGPPPFSLSLVSMTLIRRRLPTVDVAASEAGGSPLQPLGGEGTLTGGKEEGRAQSHWGEVGNSQEMSQGEEAGREEVVEEGMEIQKADSAGLFAAPGVPMGGLPSSASLVLGVEQEVQRNLLKVTQLPTRSWTTYPSEELGQIC